MKEFTHRLNLNRYWPFWSFHFGIHIVLGLLAGIGGIVIICTQSEVINGLALVGAGSFAIINGWQGFLELRKSKVHQLYKTYKKSNQ
ncbi:hypothetical protein [Pelosinus sp. sgz500959]|uniref:hypothetical protein n=1 Tax=Pelosinus sp. sgz500959 TaxID=3242472 RepID=UPI003670204C